MKTNNEQKKYYLELTEDELEVVEAACLMFWRTDLDYLNMLLNTAPEKLEDKEEVVDYLLINTRHLNTLSKIKEAKREKSA